ncbi:MAG TPA: GNAT family acetyltransferase [Vineibacter sp.]|nr:GNAT family acetyltransferase [Vineibacter sp.]
MGTLTVREPQAPQGVVVCANKKWRRARRPEAHALAWDCLSDRRERPLRPQGADFMELISRVAFGLSGALLMLLAAALGSYGIYDFVVSASNSLAAGGEGLLRAIGYLVVAIAVFDVSKYLIEEEVVRGRELRAASEARRSLTKFVSTIAIAVFLEGLVTVFRVSKDQVSDMIYPTLLLITGTLIVLGLGVYQRLSASVEREVEHRDQRDGESTPDRSKRK